MGLRFSHCNAQWSYSGFDDFRIRLAHEIGIELENMKGFAENGLKWPDSESEPLVHLLNHSDCDGELSPEQCAVVGPRLREVVSTWTITGNRDEDYDRNNALLLADGMVSAAERGESLRFC